MKRKILSVTLCVCGLMWMASGLRAQEPVAPAPTTPAATTAAPAVAPAVTPPSSTTEEVPTYDFKEADIAATLTSLARRAGLSVILSDGIIGKVTVHLENVSPHEAMKLIVESKGYVMQEEGKIVKIRTKEAAEAQPLEIRTYNLKYARVEDVKKILDDIVKGTKGKIQADLRSNTLILSDTPTQLKKIMPVLEQLDTQTPQVMIEAKFIETTKNPKKDLGINWSGALLNHKLQVRRPDPSTPIKSTASTAAVGDTVAETSANPSPLEFGKSLAGGAWMMPTAILDAGESSLVFSFLNQDADSELLASPRIVTTDNGKAKMNITQQFPIPKFTFSEQTASLQINGFEFKDIGIILNVTPHINKDNFVTLEIAPEVSTSSQTIPFSSGNGASFSIPIIDTRQAATTVLIKSGNTLAMGGLIREDVADTYTKVPIMGDIPGLGALFRSKSLSRVKRNLLVFLTPTVVSANASNPTGLEQYSNGLPPEDVFTNDKWMSKDTAKPRKFITLPESKPARSSSLMSYTPDTAAPAKAPTANFGPAK